jgi:aryl-alcohol dehydrogenase-like predicted oxidoreductase
MPESDRRRRHPRFQPENLARNVELVAQLTVMAAEKGVTPAQLALAWLLAQGEDIVPIPGTNRVRNLDLNIAAVDVAITQDEVNELSRIFAPGAGAGARYGPNVLKGVGL